MHPESEQHFGSIFKTSSYQNFTCISNIFFDALRLVQKRDNIDLITNLFLFFSLFNRLDKVDTGANNEKTQKTNVVLFPSRLSPERRLRTRFMKKCSGGRMEVLSERVSRWC